MATDKPRKTEILTPLRDGELWRINGIAEATENRLHAAGIQTFRQLASLTPAEIASYLPGQVGAKERAARQDWAGQARKLAETLEHESPAASKEELAERQHYESFVVELLLDDERSVRRTRISNVRCGQKDGWAGWDPARLGDWITREANLQAPRDDSLEQKGLRAGIGGILTLLEVTISAQGTDRASRFSPPDQPIDLTQPVDLAEVIIPPGVQAAYQATVEAKRVGSVEQIVLGQIQGVWDGAQQASLHIPLQPLTPGTYRFSTTVMIYPQGSPQPLQDGIMAFRDGGLMHVYDW